MRHYAVTTLRGDWIVPSDSEDAARRYVADRKQPDDRIICAKPIFN